MLSERELLRFWPKVDMRRVKQCWPWTGAQNEKGYGYFWREGGALWRAHRVMWEAAHGEIPDGLCVCHTCDNKLCVNPLHLWLGTVAENNADMVRKGRAVQPQLRGERNGRAKLTREQVLEIRVLAGKGETQRALGRCFGVSRQTVSYIVHRRTWAWLEG